MKKAQSIAVFGFVVILAILSLMVANVVTAQGNSEEISVKFFKVTQDPGTCHFGDLFLYPGQEQLKICDSAHATHLVQMSDVQLTASQTQLKNPVAVGSLPSCAVGTVGQRLLVNDEMSSTPGTAVAGSGSIVIAVQCIYTGSAYAWIVD